MLNVMPLSSQIWLQIVVNFYAQMDTHLPLSQSSACHVLC